ncbi:hypothetical protein Tco_0890681 [Tanacetum coccineum]|uniref:Uncharacterized protein n=1 Tax=Tanacetum coccineum TaxID=301880 RepID=A0ABQ5C693_9ASTR
MHLRCGSLVIPGISLGFLVGGHGSSQRGTIRMEGLEYKSCPVHSSTLSFPLLENAPESSQVVVISKFDMHIHTSTLTTKELKRGYYGILHPNRPASSLKDWKKKFFLIDRRAIPDAMPWRHIDTDVRDDFPVNYKEGDADRLAEHIILLVNTNNV